MEILFFQMARLSDLLQLAINSKIVGEIIIWLLRSGNVKPFSRVLQLEGLLKMVARSHFVRTTRIQHRRYLASEYTTLHY
jgi:hypothetical protein